MLPMLAGLHHTIGGIHGRSNLFDRLRRRRRQSLGEQRASGAAQGGKRSRRGFHPLMIGSMMAGR